MCHVRDPHFQPWISVLEHIIFTSYQKIWERLPYVPPPPTKKKKSIFSISNSFLSSISLVSYILLLLYWVSSEQTQANIFQQGTAEVSNSDPVISSQQLFNYTKQERAGSYRSRNDYIKNSAISVVAGAIYMHSLAPSRCYNIIPLTE